MSFLRRLLGGAGSAETMAVHLEAMHARRDEFESLSRELGGEYGGWGATA